MVPNSSTARRVTKGFCLYVVLIQTCARFLSSGIDSDSTHCHNTPTLIYHIISSYHNTLIYLFMTSADTQQYIQTWLLRVSSKKVKLRVSWGEIIKNMTEDTHSSRKHAYIHENNVKTSDLAARLKLTTPVHSQSPWPPTGIRFSRDTAR